MELVLPKNYVEVTEEEKMYLEGGFGIPCQVVSFAINDAVNYVIGLYTGGGGGIYLAKAWIRKIGTGAATRAFTSGLSRFIQTQVANRISGIVVGTLLGAGALSIGGVVAKYWDQRDRYKNNGWCDF